MGGRATTEHNKRTRGFDRQKEKKKEILVYAESKGGRKGLKNITGHKHRFQA